MTGGSLTGVTVRLKVAGVGVEPSSLPSSTATWKLAAVVSEPSCWKLTRPAASCAPVKVVAAAPLTSSVPARDW